MIIGTAGHIDHGKTTLVKALTGVDTDRLKEEKERGITVDLGFAYHPAPEGGVWGFVDVPGHERLVRNMLAGATGIDHVMLVVAADDGPMPQTREHLAILDLLGLQRGVVAITKRDLVGDSRWLEVQAEVQALLEGTGLEGAPCVGVSSTTGEGLDELKAHLEEASRSLPSAHTEAGAGFRLAIDRSFTLDGIGTVVTGTAVSGEVKVGDTLTLSPTGLTARVRGLHAQQQPAERAHAGQRVALNLAGVDKGQVQRGHWAVSPELHAPTRRLDARLRLLPSEAKALAHWTPVHVHLGAQDVTGRVLLLQDEALAPGREAWVQLELDRPMCALRGDRFILRDQSATRTLGGGRVVDAFPGADRRRRAVRLAALQAMALPTPELALQALLALHPVAGVAPAPFALQWNLKGAAWAAVAAQVEHHSVETPQGAVWMAPAQWSGYADRVHDALATHHRRLPDSPGLAQDALARVVRDKPVPVLFLALLNEMVRQGRLQRRGPHLALSGHEASLQGIEKVIWERLKPSLDEGGCLPPRLSELLERDRSLRKDQVARTLERLQRMGKVHLVANEYVYQTHFLRDLAQKAKALADADEHRRLNVRALRESVGVSRHLSVPLVEYFDEIGLTARDAVGRHFKRDPLKFFASD